MYKLVAIDLDGTMLNSYGEVTENTKRVIKEKNSNDTKIIIASGRNLNGIKNIANEVGLNEYIIAGNGATIYDVKEDKILYNKYMPKSKVLNIIKICEENSIYYSVYTNNEIIAQSLKYNVLFYYKENLKKEENKKICIKIVQDIYEYIKQLEDEEVFKIFICDNSQAVFNSIVKKLKDIKDVEILDVSHMSRKIIQNGSEEIPIEYFYTEVSEVGVDKWNAIEFLSQKLDINYDEIITIGDNINDKKMIEKSGLGIAMKGSREDIIKVANFVTEDTNDNEGVAKALEKFL